MGLADGVISLLEEKGRLSEDQINSIRHETHPEKQIQKDSSGFRRIK